MLALLVSLRLSTTTCQKKLSTSLLNIRDIITGQGVGIPLATLLGKVEPKALPSFDSLAILLSLFTQQLKLNIKILLFPTQI